MTKLVWCKFYACLVPQHIGYLPPQTAPVLGVHFTPRKQIRICALRVECAPVSDIGFYPLAQSNGQLEDQINLAVTEIAQNHGYDMILSSPVIYADDALDITGLILQQLQLEFEADQLELAQP